MVLMLTGLQALNANGGSLEMNLQLWPKGRTKRHIPESEKEGEDYYDFPGRELFPRKEGQWESIEHISYLISSISPRRCHISLGLVLFWKNRCSR